MQEANLLSLSTEFKHKCQLYSCPLFSISIYIYFNIAVSRKRGVFRKLFPLECKTNKRYTLYSVRRDFIVCYTVIQFHLASLLTNKNNLTHFCEFQKSGLFNLNMIFFFLSIALNNRFFLLFYYVTFSRFSLVN